MPERIDYAGTRTGPILCPLHSRRPHLAHHRDHHVHTPGERRTHHKLDANPTTMTPLPCTPKHPYRVGV